MKLVKPNSLYIALAGINHDLIHMMCLMILVYNDKDPHNGKSQKI